MGLLAYDRARLDALRIAIEAARDDLHRIRSDDSAAAEAIRIVRNSCRTLGDIHLPRVQAVLNSEAMTSGPRVKLDGTGWVFATDPQPVYGPQLPGARSFDEVLSGIRCGELVPLAAPIDANGRAGSLYTSIALAPGNHRPVGQQDLTSDALKLLNFLSDGLPVGWRETQTLTISYLTNARVTKSVHVLTAYDRDSGPDTLIDETEEATMSGYLVIHQASATGEVSVSIGPGEQDDTLSYPIISESSTRYSGVFYPDYAPDFQPLTGEARFVNPDRWTFTTSSAPMVDGWGTWGL